MAFMILENDIPTLLAALESREREIIVELPRHDIGNNYATKQLLEADLKATREMKQRVFAQFRQE